MLTTVEQIQKSIHEFLYGNVSAFPLTDAGTGKLFSLVFQNQHRYNTTEKRWFSYDGIRWKPDEESVQTEKSAKLFAAAYLAWAVEERPRDQKYLPALVKLQNIGNLRRVLQAAKSDYPMAAADIDKDGWLFNCQNGIYDLQEMKLIDHEAGFLLSEVSNVVYDPNASSTEWERFLSEIMQADTKKIKYLQRCVGYALLGNPTEEKAFVLWGRTTRNGKSTFTETLLHMFGSYGKTMQPESLAMTKNKNGSSASPDVARLADCRFLNVSEPPQGMYLDAQLLKQLTGRDTIVARGLYQNSFEFRPKFTLFMNTNYLPTISDSTVFSSDRLSVVTFDRHFSNSEQDKHLKERLAQPENISGIFNWCLQGVREYREHGLNPPATVLHATSEYAGSQDKVQQYLDDTYEPSEGHNIPVSKAYRLYEAWCADNGLQAFGKQRFIEELKRKEVYKKTGTCDGRSVRNVLTGYQLIIRLRTA
ncbi:MAG: phage/plasmid primase, P4 family [Lachnospiraceae bacterium]|nr:phage/plasmid primase, P4 family [Lachnospiraceae bacterium]